MDIQNSFEFDQAEKEIFLNGEEESELKNYLSELLGSFSQEASEAEMTDLAVELASYAFVAGRNYQSALTDMINVSMTPDMVEEFIAFLMKR